jgi:NAD(P)-dependent dehydrogenase (short-subunit alcohol dehydrogenase family)
MDLADRHVVITGAAHGIGRALAFRIAAERPRALVVADLDGPRADVVAREIGAVAAQVDVRRESDIRSLIKGAQAAAGPIDLFCSNAGGILAPEDVAECVVAGIRDERFLILPHPRVAQNLAHKASDPEGWLSRMRSFVRKARSENQTSEIGAT